MSNDPIQMAIDALDYMLDYASLTDKAKEQSVAPIKAHQALMALRQHQQCRIIKWVPINEKYGPNTHVFNVHYGPIRLIGAKTYRAIGTKGSDAPLWYGIINEDKFGPFHTEEEALDTMNAALKFAGFAPPAPKNENDDDLLS